MMSMDDKSILLRQREDGTWEEKPEPYVTIECETEEDFNHIKRCLEATRWIPVEERLPNEKEFIKEYRRNHHAAEFIVMIEGATLPTTLYYLKDTKSWVDENQNYYRVVAWQPLPEPYRPSDEQPKDSQGI